MKKTLAEELERIHSITYGKQLMEQEDFLDKLLAKAGLKKGDDPKKADLVTDDVKDFFDTLQQTADSGGVSQQELGSMEYQKGVESMQIGLTLLGYQLPKYGVDGLFGPETATAVQKFTQENVSSNIKEAAEEIRTTLDDLGYTEKGNELTSGGDVTDELSGIVSNILKDYKTAKPNVKVTLTSGNDKFHKNLNYTSKHTTGQAVDLVISPYNAENSKAFLEILNKYKSQNSKFNFIDEYKNPTGAATGGHFHLQFGEGGVKGGGPMKGGIQATPEMLTKLIEMLKQKGVTSDDLKKRIDTIDTSDLADKNFYAKILENLGAPITDENMKFMYGWRQAEGKGGKFNPFNTTWDLPGSTVINSHGVRSYNSLEDGLVATVKTLKHPRYSCIVNGLKDDIGAIEIARCPALKTWGTGDLVVKVVSGYNNGAEPKIASLA
jgi:peptidoglycan hydrolase-like protein with peptidoglycan-binding domain